MDIRGEWFNELNSRMNIKEVDGQVIRGVYESAVGKVKGEYPMLARVSRPSDDNRTIGWVVTWQNDIVNVDVATSWCGQIREVGGEQYITTTWLVTGETAPADDWESTTIGQDRFTRVKRTPEDVALAMALARKPRR